MCSSEAIASVISLPPVISMRTNRGTPRSCTTTLVTPPPTQTIASLAGSAAPNPRSVRGQGADQRERDDVDERRREAGAVDRREQRAHHVALRGDQQDPHHRLLLGPHELLEDLEVEDGLVDRDGDELLHLVAQRRPQVLLRHRGQLGLAHDHPLVGHADDDVAALEAGLAPEPADGSRHRRRVDDLAVAHRAQGQRHLAEAVQVAWSPRPSTISAARTAWVPMSRPMTRDAISQPPAQVGVDVALAEPVAAAHPGRPEVAGLDQPVDGHVRHAHARRDLSHGQQAVFTGHVRPRAVGPQPVGSTLDNSSHNVNIGHTGNRPEVAVLSRPK